MSRALEVYHRARACFAALPVPNISKATEKGYQATFRRMLKEPELDPLREGDARDTYNYRRASLHWGARNLIGNLLSGVQQAVRQQDEREVHTMVATLEHVLNRIEPALERDPPLLNSESALECPPSRWQDNPGPHPRRGKGSKRHVLGKLPDDWTDRFWQAVPENAPERPAVAVLCLTPCRTAELVSGQRGRRRAEGVEVTLLSEQHLRVRVAPVKTRDGLYGTPECGLDLDPEQAGAPAQFLAELCRQGGGNLTVSVSSTDVLRKAVGRHGRRAMPGLPFEITPGVFRHQGIADLKATLGSGGDVASAAGQGTDKTQHHYGYVHHGRVRKGILSVFTARPPRLGAVERARQLGEARRSPGRSLSKRKQE